MRILLISNDTKLIELVNDQMKSESHHLKIIRDNADPLDAMASVCKLQPSVLIIDDDFMRPASSHLLKSIKKVNSSLSIIFVSSDNSLELGREISQFGIQYYALKPIQAENFKKSIQSIMQQKQLIN